MFRITSYYGNQNYFYLYKSEFASTCHKCYFAVLPHIWPYPSLNNTKELDLIVKHLNANTIWTQRTIQFLRDVSLISDDGKPQFSSTSLAASLIWLFQIFPHLSNPVFDFMQAIKNFYFVSNSNNKNEDNNRTLPFSGSISLVNYKTDHSQFMHYLLAPFRKTDHLKIQALPVYSLCDDIDESILANDDIKYLASLGLTHLRRLELSYLDSVVCLDTIKT
ncbi:uncharacterized protein BX663DRAFT_571989 [Cokeromyces recurvatus]|uniref:uncharacterized protein n=1 Tax=Cokeromyces recurvatus TaxID=90255 RepID=UPI00221F810F|nr:uncharacterized protein BX663DRAFT_571989 [Cokeromyces recurvatus]KAI7901408.1 hypothetical protein BX663DRAFT_571989 [Cokeromyces recurvatus]